MKKTPSFFRINPNINQKKVGVILPSVNRILEPEFYALAPKGISFHTTRMLLKETTPEGVAEMERDLERALELIATLFPDAVLYGCTSGSFMNGPAWEKGLIETMSGVTRCPVTTTSTAMVEGLRQVKAKRIVLATPYLDSVNRHEVNYLEKQGFEILQCVGLGLSGTQIREKTPQEVYDLVKRAFVPGADAVFISCTDFRAMEAIDALEKELTVPILSSNQVSLWAILRLLKVSKPIRGYGKLLSSPLSFSL
jgi:maleate isomerase